MKDDVIIDDIISYMLDKKGCEICPLRYSKLCPGNNEAEKVDFDCNQLVRTYFEKGGR